MKLEFQLSVNDVKSQSGQQYSLCTEAGDFQEANNISCSYSAPTYTITQSGSSTSTEGSSDDCIFIGKVVQFATNTGSAPKQYITYPIAGYRNNNGSIYTANPTAVAPGNSSNNTFPDDGVPSYLLDGLTVYRMQAFFSGAIHWCRRFWHNE